MSTISLVPESSLPRWRGPTARVLFVLVAQFVFLRTFIAIFPLLNHTLRNFYHAHSHGVTYFVHHGLIDLLSGLSFFGALWLVQRVFDRKPFSPFGPTTKKWAEQIVAGLGIGLLMWLLLLGFDWVSGNYRINGIMSFSVVPFVHLVLAVSVGVLAEECFFRGYILPTLERRWGTRVAFTLTTLAFALGHGQYDRGHIGENIVHPVLHALALGSLLGMAYLVTRTVWFPVGIHFAWNFLGALCFDSHAYNVYSIFHYSFHGHAFLLSGIAFQASVVICSLAALILFRMAVHADQSRKRAEAMTIGTPNIQR